MSTFRKTTVIAVVILTIILLSACGKTSDEAVEQQELTQKKPVEQLFEEQTQDQMEPEEGMPPTALEAAATVISILKEGNMSMLSAWAHPEKGVRFSPYGYVDKETDLVFSKDELQQLMEDSTVYVWRTFA
ncbi:hypothetical protein [Psychrobacillus sp. NPDC096623]|uniref:hypothetical protein n=1 Tax=Psychrobacillus sp. NPDC096623 TaxID=3364492 RepID=UPI00380CF3CD